MPEIKRVMKKQDLPLLPLRGLTVFPYMILTFDVGREKSIKALDEAMINNQMIFLVTQKEAKNDSPGEEDLYAVGTISKVKQLLRLPGDTIRVLVEGMGRARIRNYLQTEPFFVAEVTEDMVLAGESRGIEHEALKRRVLDTYEEYIKLSGKISPESALSLETVENIGQLSDIVASNVLLKVEQKQEILDEFHPVLRAEKLLALMMKEIEILEVEKDINVRVRKQIDKMQKEYYLREQIKAIQTELGDDGGSAGEIEEYREKLKIASLPPEAEKKVNKELDRLAKMRMEGSSLVLLS